MKHTPTPWIIYDDYIAAKNHVKNENWDKAWICQWGSYTSKANAAHIVKCVNLHDELIECGNAICSAIGDEATEEIAISKWRKALAKARGGATNA